MSTSMNRTVSVSGITVSSWGAALFMYMHLNIRMMIEGRFSLLFLNEFLIL